MKILLSFIPILVFGSCLNQPKQKDKLHIEKTTKPVAHTILDQSQDSLIYLYDNDAIKILEDERVLIGSVQIEEFISSQSLKLISIHSDTIIAANERRAIDYEISEHLYEGDISYKNLIIWQTSNDEKMKVFEFAAKVEKSESVLSEIDKRRELWIALCNQNNAKGLIDEMYSENTLYYNHKPLVKGRALLVDEYQYMNRETYKLHLRPEFVDQVNDQFVFEIGQCSGGYGGKYILIWRKESDGQWRIFIDSNI